MDQRFYFIVGDLIAAIITGALVGALSALLVDTSWNMWVAMVIVMVLGMIIGTLVFFPLSVFFGAMEIMIPCMLGGMISGMAVSMWASMQDISGIGATILGIQSSLCALLFIWVANTLLRSKTLFTEGKS